MAGSTASSSATLVGILALLVALWREAHGGVPVPQTLVLLMVGPLLTGAFFWLALALLLALIWLFGAALAGIGWLIATFAGVYKVTAFCIGVLKGSDSLAEHGARAADTIEELKQDKVR